MLSEALNVGKMRLNTDRGPIDPIRIDNGSEDDYVMMSKLM